MIIPENIDFQRWAGQLVIDFPNDNVPNIANFPSWQEWGRWVSTLPSFLKNFCPAPQNNEQDWKIWARKVIQVMY